jgi:hypothetical protein
MVKSDIIPIFGDIWYYLRQIFAPHKSEALKLWTIARGSGRVENCEDKAFPFDSPKKIETPLTDSVPWLEAVESNPLPTWNER